MSKTTLDISEPSNHHAMIRGMQVAFAVAGVMVLVGLFLSFTLKNQGVKNAEISVN